MYPTFSWEVISPLNVSWRGAGAQISKDEGMRKNGGIIPPLRPIVSNIIQFGVFAIVPEWGLGLYILYSFFRWKLNCSRKAPWLGAGAHIKKTN